MSTPTSQEYEQDHATCETDDSEQQEQTIQNQCSPFSNASIQTETTFMTNLVNDSHFSHSLLESEVTVNLYDCMQCYIRIPQYEIKDDPANDNTNAYITLEDEIRERQEEEEKTSATPTPIRQQQYEEDDGELYIRGLDFEDFNMMGNYIYIDSPWPDTPE
ncbi:unnamed protein product [Adineta steineri]|uniref:Uncharacterized protein n=1 Tax=Adineta steineri TaxID=433720 RepID=A0A820G5D1_9BILA|nr:unnamed protein product [Adineta steineri]CAF4273039.1 unnamed protein product [Adineta steineri]